MRVEYNSTARREIIQTAEYYAQERENLGAEFLAEVDSAIAAVTANPASFEQVGPGIRRYLFDRFPYAMFYRTPDAQTVRIIVVRHHARRPGLGMRRK